MDEIPNDLGSKKPRTKEPIVPVNGTFNRHEALLVTAMAEGRSMPFPELKMSRAEYMAAFDIEKYASAVMRYHNAKLKLLCGKAVGLCDRAVSGRSRRGERGVSAATQKFAEYVLDMNGFKRGSRLESAKDGKTEKQNELDDLVVTN